MGGQNQISGTASDGIVLAVTGKDSVTNNGAEAIDLGTKLDLDRLVGLNLNSSFALIGGKRGVGGDI